MSKAQLFQELESLSRAELDELADRVDELRGGVASAEEIAVIRERIADYRKHPDDLVDLDEAIAELTKK